MNPIRPIQILLACMLALGSLFQMGCSAWRERRDKGEFKYEEPKLPPLAEPDIIRTQQYLRETPSGRLNSLQPTRIAIVAQPDFVIGSDPTPYLRNQVKKAKQAGAPFLPCHYYIAPEGLVLEGVGAEYCGFIGSRRVGDALLVGVLGDFDKPTNFMPTEQQQALIQLCAWLCAQHSIQPSRIVPATEISNEAEPLGVNLMNWFGPTQTLRDRVTQVLEKNAPKAAKQRKKDSRQESSLFEGSKGPSSIMMDDY